MSETADVPTYRFAEALHARHREIYARFKLNNPDPWAEMTQYERDAYAQLAAAVLTVGLTEEEDRPCRWQRAGAAFRDVQGPSENGPPLEQAGTAHLPPPFRSWADHAWAAGWLAKEAEIDLKMAKRAALQAESLLSELRQKIAAKLIEPSTPTAPRSGSARA